MEPRPLDWPCPPVEALRRWPRTLPLAALVTGAPGPSARWSILGVASEWESVPNRGDSAEAFNAFQSLAARWSGRPRCWQARRGPGTGDSEQPERVLDGTDRWPFRGGWIGFLSYELASLLEPASLRHGACDSGFELVGGWHCRGAAVHDAAHDRWWWCGPDGCRPPPLEPSESEMPGALRNRPPGIDSASAPRLGPIRPRIPPGGFASMVKRAIELIHAGDLYQANLAHWFDARFRGSTRALAAAAIAVSGARYGAVIETPDGRAVISMSPELFLERIGDAIRTRPIKGTRPIGADQRELMENPKERAELAMIVDLMRNDLARVCRPGSVRVLSPRRIETHCGVEHAVAEVVGRLRCGVPTGRILAATLPPGSVTGAPKIRAMQVIELIEQQARGPYCGAVGLVGDDGDLRLAVAIRTLLRRGEEVSYAVGCGIVADSIPAQEEAESLTKLEPFRRVAAHLTESGSPPVTPREAACASAAPGSAAAPAGRPLTAPGDGN